jgi:demethylmenaquinone methyltransferase/2-methoxy-6-polyprenyl-1,4-benzoquinol methylase|tara:strand:- start:531 stop:1232 length:702 start_codon:yes stop_codon:yes gene_type:complete
VKPRDPKSVKKLFESISHKYDFLNDLFSFGLHRLWKKQLLSLLEPSSGQDWIDLCCGTGDLSFALAKLVQPFGSVLGVDFSDSQIDHARKRSFADPSLSISWLKKDVLNTGLPSASFDGVIMAYGLRNLEDPEAGLKEIHRLLKPGSQAGVLDFNHPTEGSKTSYFQKFYLRRVVVPIASLMGLRNEYAYLEESLKSFPKGDIQKKIAMKIGFKEARYQLLLGGQMGILLLTA